MSLERVLGMVVKEFRQVFRDPRMARVIFVAPVLQLLVFGYAVSTDIHDTPTFVVDHDRSLASRELVDVLTASGY
ncbi:MAG: ABC transporter permease, partial [Vicinamibacteria bacterium]